MLRKSLFVLLLGVSAVSAGIFGRSHRSDDTVDRVQGVKISSRRPCDGATNPQEELKFQTTFSPGGWERAFHLDRFENQYCKHVDLYFFCLVHGRDRWKHDWEQDSRTATASSRDWINSCNAWESKDAPEYILSGWYQEGPANPKAPWKQAQLKPVSTNPEVYEFTDGNGGTARVEIQRK